MYHKILLSAFQSSRWASIISPISKGWYTHAQTTEKFPRFHTLAEKAVMVMMTKVWTVKIFPGKFGWNRKVFQCWYFNHHHYKHNIKKYVYLHNQWKFTSILLFYKKFIFHRTKCKIVNFFVYACRLS